MFFGSCVRQRNWCWRRIVGSFWPLRASLPWFFLSYCLRRNWSISHLPVHKPKHGKASPFHQMPKVPGGTLIWLPRITGPSHGLITVTVTWPPLFSSPLQSGSPPRTHCGEETGDVLRGNWGEKGRLSPQERNQSQPQDLASFVSRESSGA